ncbi:MAG: transglycosylase SLT domain-containing protein [Candidatus Cryptobacteroides sp.]
MRLKEKTKRKLRIVLASMLVICIGPICERVENVSGASNLDAFAGKDIVCAIELGDELYGAETGLNYEILEKFARDNKCGIRIVAGNRGTDYIDSLRMGKVDIVIKTSSEGIANQDDIMVSREMGGRSVWALSVENPVGLRQVNSWLSHFTESEDYTSLQKRFFCSYNPFNRASDGVRSRTLSPYDQLIKKYASTLGWDWRMLAAVLYQESKFCIGVRSGRGATGLMQVMPQTGKHYGIDNLLDPEQNIIAGVSHLKRLQEMFRKCGIEGEELVKFTLAAYNAGEGRIADCRNLAEAMSVDSRRWDDVVNIIPMMREDSILQQESVKFGKFQGYETIAYVDSVLAIYDAFCAINPAA